MDITPAQCRAARSLLDMTQDRLATLSRVSKRTVVSFEAGNTKPVPVTLDAMRRALETAGIEFISGGAKLREPADV